MKWSRAMRDYRDAMRLGSTRERERRVNDENEQMRKMVEAGVGIAKELIKAIDLYGGTSPSLNDAVVRAEKALQELPAPTRPERLEVGIAMKRYGGSFVQALGEAVMRADGENVWRIKQAFPELWQRYYDKARGNFTGENNG